jgi:hypothetical protein
MKSKSLAYLSAAALGAVITIATPAMAFHGGGFGGGGMHFGGGGFGGGGMRFGGVPGGGMHFGGMPSRGLSPPNRKSNNINWFIATYLSHVYHPYVPFSMATLN